MSATMRAEIARSQGGAGVQLVVWRDERQQCSIYFPSAEAAMRDPRGRQWRWARWSAIGAATLYRGELEPWEPEARAS